MKTIQGGFYFWQWTDKEIEEPKLLKSRLVSLSQAGFSTLFVGFGNTRYEIMDPKVIRAMAQVSQWAEVRGLQFYFEADPRRATRSLIEKTGESLQLLLFLKNPRGPYHSDNFTLTKVKKNRFAIRCAYRFSHRIEETQEKHLALQPSGLEKAYRFKMENGMVIKATVQDITSETRFFANIGKGHVEIFGNAGVDENEKDWWVLAFPRFDTNLLDFWGRESRDALVPFIENLFDSGLISDGVFWAKAGFGNRVFQLPVSLSIFNSFLAEYGYDLREKLYALVLPLDDGSHIPVRCDYYGLLMDGMYSGHRDFFTAFHGFFDSVSTGIFYQWAVGSHENLSSAPYWDPWQGLGIGSVGCSEMELNTDSPCMDEVLGVMVLARSLGVFSQGKQAIFRCTGRKNEKALLERIRDFAWMHSLQWLEDEHAFDPESPSIELNQKIQTLHSLTGFRFPVADVLLVYPLHTFLALDPVEAEAKRIQLIRWIGFLTRSGVQLDVCSPSQLLRGKFSNGGFRIGLRMYQKILYPYPTVVCPEILDLLYDFLRSDLIWMGETMPQWTSSGNPISLPVKELFQLNNSLLEKFPIPRMFEFPSNTVATVIRHLDEVLLLVSPVEIGKECGDWIRFENRMYKISPSTELAIYRVQSQAQLERVY